MKNRDRKENKEKTPTPITKESICATCAVFAFMAFLILCTKSLVFGEVGFAVFAFLTGLFGLFAYPVVLGGLYLSVMGLIGVRLVKNRRAGACIAVSVLLIGLIVHTAVTYTWQLDGYAAKCFYAGEGVPTVTGWLGGLVVLALSCLMTKIGTLVLLSVFTAFCVYLTVLCFKNPTATVVQKSEKRQADMPVYQIPVAMPVANDIAVSTPPVAEQQPVQDTYYPREAVTQRPGVSLRETEEYTQRPQQPTAQAPQPTSYSPFGGMQPSSDAPRASFVPQGQTAKEFLFNTPPDELYRMNRIFDRDARVNNLPTNEQTANAPFSGYTPSYSEAYQNAVNEQQEETPTKIVKEERDYGAPAFERAYDEPITPVQPMEIQEPVMQQPVAYPTLQEEQNGLYGLREEPQAEEEAPVEEQGTRTEGYQRHDYMSLFSLDNPNVFGRNDEEEKPADRFSERESLDRTEYLDNRYEERRDYETPDEERRDGLHLLDDEPEDDPYTLRDDFSSDRRDIGDRVEESSRFEDSRYTQEARDDTPELTAFERGGRETEPVQEPPQPVQEPPKPAKPRVFRPYMRIRLDDLDCRDVEPTADQMLVEETKQNIIATLEDFKVTGASIASVTFGPAVTRYNVTLPRGISPNKVVALDKSISISLHSEGVNVYPNYEDGVVSVEVPNKERQTVHLGSMLSGDSFVNAKPSSLMFAMGKDVANRKIYGDISKMIHLLVAGSSGSGKSVFLNALIISLIYKYSPEELRLILVDPKKTEFALYNDLPHLMINEIITDAKKVVQALGWAIGEMNRRYDLFEKLSRQGLPVVNLDQYNAKVEREERLPKIVIIIDELADLMLAAKKDVEDRIQNLTQKARASGIHLIVATQRPSKEVITGVIKSNLATRIAFAVPSEVDSRVILDQMGAQNLLGKGDFLYTMQGIVTPVRVQSAFISPEESQKVVNFIKEHTEAYYDEEATAYINNSKESGGDPTRVSGNNVEQVYIDALRHVVLNGNASISMVQRKCFTGYNKAGKIIEWMEEMGYISAFDGAKARKCLFTKEQFEQLYGPL